jgi:rhodanese-related sulfurtransferase
VFATMKRSATPDELRARLERRDVLVVDVHRQSDYDADSKMIPGAIRRDPDAVEQWSEKLPRDKEIIVYCARGGSVSKEMVDRLEAKGFRARYLEGGIEGWRQAGGETVDK